MQRPKYSSLSEYIRSAESGRELFDLKEQFDEELWRRRLNMSIVNNGSALTDFLAYKGLPEFCGFDCDGTIPHAYGKQGYYSWFTREIYRVLWNWQDLCETDEEEFKNIPVKRYAKSCFEDMEMGPDTMNSFWITFCTYLVSFFEDTYKWNNFKNTFLFKAGENDGQRKRAIRLKSDIESRTETRISNEEINMFAQLTHTIGNMVLVPAGYNGYRGTKQYLKDYFDLSLDNLLYSRDKNHYLDGENEERQQRKYVNTFFLWDYVDKNYEVRPLCNSHEKKIQKKTLDGTHVLPEKEEIDDLCNNINNRIKRRGFYMLAMLKIASGMNYDGESKYQYCQKQYKEWQEWNVSGIYKLFMGEVFLNNKIYDGYGDVIKKMVVVADKEVKGKTSEKEWKWLCCILEELSALV